MSEPYGAFTPLEVPDDVLDALASAGGGPRSWALLRAARRSRNLLLLRGLSERARAADPGVAAPPAADLGVADLGPAHPRAAHPRPADPNAALDFLESGLALLRTVQTRAPAVFTEVMDDPMTGAWLGCWARSAPLSEPAAHAAALAASAALRARLPFRITVPVRSGAVMLPALGLARPPGAPDTAEVTYESGHAEGRVVGPEGYVRVPAGGGPIAGEPPRGEWAWGERALEEPAPRGERAGDEPAPRGERVRDASAGGTPHRGDGPGSDGWYALPRMRCVAGARSWAPQLDSLNPFRVGHQLVAPRVLDAAEVAGWQRELAAAWKLLARRHPERADEIGGLQSSVVPLGGEEPTVDGRGGWLSATLGDAVGHIALAPHPGTRALAAGLIHETQHSKLCALLDVVDLTNAPPDTRCYSPWREDPRPVSGLLHGAYAFLAVTEFWRGERGERAEPGRDGESPARFVLRYEQVRGAIAALDASAWLTGDGRRFVTAMRRTLASLADAAPDPRESSRALAGTADHRVRWRLRHLPQPPPAAVRLLAAAHAQGRPAPDAAAALLPGPGAHPPDRWALPAAHPPPDAARTTADLDAALSVPGAGTPEQWARLAAAALLLADDRATALAAAPELVHAVHTALRRPGPDAPPEAHCSPLDLARWLLPVMAARPATPGA